MSPPQWLTGPGPVDLTSTEYRRARGTRFQRMTGFSTDAVPEAGDNNSGTPGGRTSFAEAGDAVHVLSAVSATRSAAITPRPDIGNPARVQARVDTAICGVRAVGARDMRIVSLMGCGANLEAPPFCVAARLRTRSQGALSLRVGTNSFARGT